MSHTHRSFVILISLCVGLSACAGASPVPITAPLPTETLTPAPIPTETLAPTLTPEPTAEAYNYDVERAKQDAIIENATNRVVDFEYLNSPEYLNWLKVENGKGNFPEISNEAFFVQPEMIVLDFDNEPTAFFKKYGITDGFRFSDYTYKWRKTEARPWVIVDAGLTNIGKSDIGFFVVKWKNLDGSEAFWGHIFTIKDSGNVIDEFSSRIDRNGIAYPTVAYFDSVSSCLKIVKTVKSQSYDYCDFLGSNPESAIPKDMLRNWKETGILKLDFLPWSHAYTELIK